MSDEEEKQWHLPEKFRITPERKTEREQELLAQADAQQKEWRESHFQPIALQTPKERERANAVILIEAFRDVEKAGGVMTDSQKEQLAEFFAVIGEYKLAAQTTVDEVKRQLYKKYWNAVWLPDGKWCAHDELDKYIKEQVWSVKEKKEMPLLACNKCGTWNVLDAPPHLLDAQQNRASVRRATRGMSMQGVRTFLTGRAGKML